MACSRTYRLRVVPVLTFVSMTSFPLGPSTLLSTAEEPAADVSESDFNPARVDRLLKQLDGPKRSDRVRAEAELSDLPASAIDRLPAGDGGLSAEAAERLSRVRDILRRKRDEQAVASGQTTVTFRGETRLGDALDEITVQTGVGFRHDADPTTVIAPNFAKLEFWHAVDVVLDQADLTVDPYGGDRETLALVPRPAESPRRADVAAYAEAFRLVPNRVVATRSMVRPELSGLNVTLDIAWMPGRTPVGLSIAGTSLKATLRDGVDLSVQNAAGTIEVGVSPEICQTDFYVPLNLPDVSTGRIERLTGTIDAMMPGPTATFRFPLADGGGERTEGGMTVRVDSPRRDGPLTQLRVTAELDDPGRALESHRQWLIENETYVVGEDGERFDPLGFEVMANSDRGATVGYLFDVGDEPTGTLVYRSPTSISRRSVPFILDDIPLP